MLKRIFIQIRFHFFNTLLGLILFNLVLGGLYAFKDSFFPTNPIFQLYGKAKVLQAYPQQNVQEVAELLAETWGRPYAYQPFTAFKEKEFRGKYINIHSAGFRYGKNQGDFPLKKEYFNVFVLGGSTTFGYGVKDEETISSFLQMELDKKKTHRPVKCYSFASGFHYSSQERAFLETLLENGQVPDLVIFIDGLNEFFFAEPYQSNLAKNLYEQKSNTLFWALLNHLPMSRLAKYFQAENPISENSPSLDFYKKSIHRYFQNQKMIDVICKRLNIKSLFVWQPIAGFEYDLKYHLFEKEKNAFPAKAYQLMQSADYQMLKPADFLDLSFIQKDLKENLYVDKVHYSPKMNRLIAQEIGKRIQLRE